VKTPEGRSVLVPFVETIVTRIDEPGRRIVLDPPEGLFDL
jgi:16S rRNA processing protein RimM